jgi:hypothetical protein
MIDFLMRLKVSVVVYRILTLNIALILTLTLTLTLSERPSQHSKVDTFLPSGQKARHRPIKGVAPAGFKTKRV